MYIYTILKTILGVPSMLYIQNKINRRMNHTQRLINEWTHKQ